MIIFEWFLLWISTPTEWSHFSEKQTEKRFFVLSGLELLILYCTAFGLAGVLSLLLMAPL